jgi:hypothetical protein
MVPTVPQEVPVNSETSEQRTQAVAKKKRGEIVRRPN